MDLVALEQLIVMAGDLSPVPEGLSTFRVLPDTPLGPVKVRAYASEVEAWRQEAILKKLAGVVDYPELLGRVDQHLVFRYLEMDRDTPLDDDATYLDLGRFLGTLNTIAIDHTGQVRLDSEFAGWLGRLSALGILTPQIARRGRARYEAMRPTNLPIRLDYWDAMPHNFGRARGRLYLLDEKHLRPSYPGVGLVKPGLLLPPERWQLVRQGYAGVAPVEIFDQQRPFLTFYYTVAALFFYSLVGEAGRVSLAHNTRFLEYREWLIKTIAAGRLSDAVLGELQLYRTFPTEIPLLLRRRLGAWRDRLTGRHPTSPIEQFAQMDVYAR